MRFAYLLEEQERIRGIFQKFENVYVYGAGTYAEIFLEWLAEIGIEPYKLLVSGVEHKSIKGIAVHTFNEDFKYKGAVIVAVALRHRREILEKISGHFDEIITVADDFFKLTRMSNEIKQYEGYGTWKNANFGEIFNTRKNKKTIVLQRTGGMGDVLNIEPLCRALKKAGFYVGLMSDWGEMFYYNGSVDFCVSNNNQFPEDCALFISLDWAYEFQPMKHVLDAYIDVVRQYLPDIEISKDDRIPVYDRKLIKQHNREVKKICINAEASNWQSRIYDFGKMRKFAEYLRSEGYEIYEIGADRNNYLGIGKDCFGLDIHESVEVMSRTDLYVGLDNGLMHLAQAIRLPVFVLFGCTCPLYRIHDWSMARVMWKNIDELSCAGCYHRRRLPCIKTECMYEKRYCLDWSVDEVISAFENLTYNNPPVLQQEMLRPIWP